MNDLAPWPVLILGYFLLWAGHGQEKRGRLQYVGYVGYFVFVAVVIAWSAGLIK